MIFSVLKKTTKKLLRYYAPLCFFAAVDKPAELAMESEVFAMIASDATRNIHRMSIEQQVCGMFGDQWKAGFCRRRLCARLAQQ